MGAPSASPVDPPTVPGSLSCEIQGEPGRLAVAWADGCAVLVIDRPGVVRLSPDATRALVQRLQDMLPAG